MTTAWNSTCACVKVQRQSDSCGLRYSRNVHGTLPDFDMPGDDEARAAAERFRLLADPTRVKILWALSQGETSVACLAELVGATPTAVSQHLSKLRLAGLVRGRRDGTFVHYTAVDADVAALLAAALGARPASR
jgi:DNA-binding transcriptional ArsR family regulator